MTEHAPIWSSLVGQRHAIDTLQRAVDGHGMTHAWLFTGPPGSGRSNAAIAFAAALQCERGGCGECEACTTSTAGSHGDVHIIRTEKAQITVDSMRELVLRSALAPARGHWQVMIIEDADRLNERAANALLKAIEEPTPKTVWLLCAPSLEDVLPTIRSRCRNVVLTTPTEVEVAKFLAEKVGVPPEMAGYAARASQGHIGRARALALDEQARRRRTEVVKLPPRLTDIGACMNAANNLVEIAKEETEAQNDASSAAALIELQSIYGSDPKAKTSRTYRAAHKEMEDSLKARAKRRTLDVIDRCLMDMLSVYRDAIALASNPDARLTNQEMRPELVEFVRRTTPEENLRRIDAVFTAREQMLDFNGTPLLSLESMMVSLRTR
jgi:DNA polymerase-3 subunit delta'